MITPEAQRKGADANRAKWAARDAVVLAMLAEGATYTEVAAAIGVTPTTVRTVILKARRRAGIPPRGPKRGTDHA